MLKKGFGFLFFILLFLNFHQISFATNDLEPPVLEKVTVSQNEARPNDTFTVEMEASDNDSGLKIDGSSRSFMVLRHTENHDLDYFIYPSRSSGVNKYQGEFTVPEGIVQGDYEISSVFLRDQAGNKTTFHAPPVSPEVISITNNVTDLEPPVLEKVTVSQDQARPNDTLTVEMEASDNDSGLKISGPGRSFMVLRHTENPDLDHFIYLNRSDGADKYQGEFTVPEGIVQGDYEISTVFLEDQAGNESTFRDPPVSPEIISIKGEKIDKVSLSTEILNSSNKEFKLTAASDGDEGTEYRFFVQQRGGSLQMIQDYSSADTAAWKPSDPGIYKLIVHAKSKSQDGAGYFYEARDEILYTIEDNSLTTANLNPNMETGQPPNTSIELSAASDGGEGTEYRFFVQQRGGSLQMIQDYSSADTAAWKPSDPGIYKLIVHAKSKNQDGAGYFYEARDELRFKIITF